MSQNSSQMSDSFEICWLQHIPLSCIGCTSSLQFRIPWLWHLQHLENSSTVQAGFTFKASWNSLSRPPCLLTTDTCLALVAFLSCGGSFHNHFFIFLPSKWEPHDRSCQALLLAGAGTYPPCFLYQLSVVGFLHCLSFSLNLFTSWQLRWVVSFQEFTTIFTQLSIRQVSF